VLPLCSPGATCVTLPRSCSRVPDLQYIKHHAMDLLCMRCQARDKRMHSGVLSGTL
ncbi:hypothetical protein DAEQUDRAFT_732993, partial [Daedalea quercina L-15889]